MLLAFQKLRGQANERGKLLTAKLTLLTYTVLAD